MAKKRKAQQPQERSVAEHVRSRQRAVAEREAARLAKPEARPKVSLGHASRSKSAVSSTPFGVLTTKREYVDENGQELWCGPFSVARQMIAAREEARRAREEEQNGNDTSSHPLDGAMKELETERKRNAHPSLQWKSRVETGSSTSSLYAKRQKRASVQRQMPSLYSLCVDFLVENFDCVEALGNIDTDIRTSVVNSLIGAGKLDDESFKVIAEPGIEALEICDGSTISQDCLAKCLEKLVENGLMYLMLDQAGHCFGPKVVDTIVKMKPPLVALSVGGAYLLKDVDAAKLVESLSLKSLEVKACPLVGIKFAEAISDSLVELSLEDLSLDKEALDVLVSKPFKLTSLSFRRLENLDDATILKLLKSSNLERLDLSHNYHLTDTVLSGIRQCSHLRSLALTGLKHLTSEGLMALFLDNVPDAGPPPMLQHLDLSNCDHDAVTDGVVDLVVQAASKGPGGLKRVEIQGAPITDTSLEYLATMPLKELNVSFCTSITNKGLGYLVDNCPSLTLLHIWGCAQINDEFLDGHSRVNDPNLEIVGAWMKNSTSRTMR